MKVSWQATAAPAFFSIISMPGSNCSNVSLLTTTMTVKDDEWRKVTIRTEIQGSLCSVQSFYIYKLGPAFICKVANYMGLFGLYFQVKFPSVQSDTSFKEEEQLVLLDDSSVHPPQIFWLQPQFESCIFSKCILWCSLIRRQMNTNE